MPEYQPFPKRTVSQATGSEGIVLFEKIVRSELGWEFRRTPQESDFGIDGYVDIVTSEGYVTGRSLAVQIKTGDSYFKRTTKDGWLYHGSIKHINYYVHISCPVLLILIDLNMATAWWRLFEPYETDRSGQEWTMVIPKESLFCKSAKAAILALAGEATDYLPHLEHFWMLSEKIQKNDVLVIVVSRFEVESKAIRPFSRVCERLSTDSVALVHSRGKLDFVFSGYDDDPREVFEIPDVHNWIMNIFDVVDVLPYLLYMGENAQAVTMAISVFGGAIKTGADGSETYVIYNDRDGILRFMNTVFTRMNMVTDNYGLDDSYNERASRQFGKRITSILTQIKEG